MSAPKLLPGMKPAKDIANAAMSKVEGGLGWVLEGRMLQAMQDDRHIWATEVERLRAALFEVSTDLAQDSLERGEGAAADEAAGFRRISPRTAARVAAALDGAAR